MHGLCNTHGFTVDLPRITCGLSNSCQFPLDILWISHGLPVDHLCLICMYTLNCSCIPPEFLLEYLWILCRISCDCWIFGFATPVGYLNVWSPMTFLHLPYGRFHWVRSATPLLTCNWPHCKPNMCDLILSKEKLILTMLPNFSSFFCKHSGTYSYIG